MSGSSPQDSAGLVKPMIGREDTPLGLPVFSLVAFDDFGNPQPLPPGLGNLPLYPDNDGTFSVNGSLGLTAFFSHEALALINSDHDSLIGPLITRIAGFSCDSPHSTGAADHGSHYSNGDMITRLATSPPFHPSYYTSFSNGTVVDHKNILRGRVTSAASQAALGNPHFRRSRH